MKHDNDLPTIDKLDQGDTQLIEKLLSFLLTLINLVHGKNTPMRRLKELLFVTFRRLGIDRNPDAPPGRRKDTVF